MIDEKTANLLRAIADGKRVQEYSGIDGWWDCHPNRALSRIAGGSAEAIRIKPADTVTINGIECPAPLTASKKGESYFIFNSLGIDSEIGTVAKVISLNDAVDERRISAGVLFRSKEDAQAAFDAIAKPLRDYVAAKRGEV